MKLGEGDGVMELPNDTLEKASLESNGIPLPPLWFTVVNRLVFSRVLNVKCFHCVSVSSSSFVLRHHGVL